MSEAGVLFWGVVAVLAFWSVGAYNRLVRLRGALARRFAPVHEQLEARTALLLTLIEALEPQGLAPERELQALRAARTQADTAGSAARQTPAAAGAVNSLRVALLIVAQARERVAAYAGTSPELAALHAQIAACDSALQFAQRRFNEAVLDYNAAVRQFPARLLAAMMGFRSAGAL